jgi:hypothetical protein
VHGDLDARLELVVAPAEEVVGRDDRLEIGQQVAAGRKSRITLPIIGVRPRPPPTITSNPGSPSRRTIRSPMSCARVTARSLGEPVTAILNLRGRNWNSGWSVDHWRISSAQGRGSAISSAAAPAKWSAVTLRIVLPLVWIACSPTSASASSMSGTSTSCGQLNWMFWRVVKWP